MTTQQKILDFFKQHNDCVLATVGKDGPEAATIGFSALSNLELTIGTTKSSRKYQNMLKNPHVAIVVGFEGDITVQYEGTIRELSGQELTERKKIHFEKIPGAQHFENDDDQVYLSVAPTWARYTNYAQTEAVEELRQFV